MLAADAMRTLNQECEQYDDEPGKALERKRLETLASELILKWPPAVRCAQNSPHCFQCALAC